MSIYNDIEKKIKDNLKFYECRIDLDEATDNYIRKEVEDQYQTMYTKMNKEIEKLFPKTIKEEIKEFIDIQNKYLELNNVNVENLSAFEKVHHDRQLQEQRETFIDKYIELSAITSIKEALLDIRNKYDIERGKLIDELTYQIKLQTIKSRVLEAYKELLLTYTRPNIIAINSLNNVTGLSINEEGLYQNALIDSLDINF